MGRGVGQGLGRDRMESVPAARPGETIARLETGRSGLTLASPAGLGRPTESPPSGQRAGAGGRGRLVVVSNRVAVPKPGVAPGAGGLAVAIEAALREYGGIWFGWSGEARAAIDADALRTQTVGRITFATTDLTRRDVDDYYLGYSNRSLWPVCHYRLDLARFDAKQTAAYFRVNDLFARKLAGMVEADDLVWVHDYHLIPLAQSLRARGLRNRIGFFLHIPWPPPEVVSALPGYRRLLDSLLDYDLVGFQTARDAEHFGRCLVEEGVAQDLGDGHFGSGERRTRVGAFPISIDTQGIAALAARAAAQAAVKRMAATMSSGRKLLIGVDRLDYSKGLRERIRAFVTYLAENPEAKRQVIYLQVTPKSRSDVPEYRRLEQEVATQVGEANGACGDFDWTPIRYLNQNIAHPSLTGLYRLADVALVTPLRDGMNLVAKEYLASQDPEDPGALVLSRYAGAAAELDAAILVNPYDAIGTATAIGRALTMTLGERRERWRAMMDVLERNTVGDWWKRFLADPALSPETASEAVA